MGGCFEGILPWVPGRLMGQSCWLSRLYAVARLKKGRCGYVTIFPQIYCPRRVLHCTAPAHLGGFCGCSCTGAGGGWGGKQGVIILVGKHIDIPARDHISIRAWASVPGSSPACFPIFLHPKITGSLCSSSLRMRVMSLSPVPSASTRGPRN